MADLILKTSPHLKVLDYDNQDAATKKQIDALITVASNYIEKYCDRVFSSVSYSNEKLDGNGWDNIFIKNPPLTTLTDIDVISSLFTGSTTTTYAATRFDIKEATGQIKWKADSFLEEGGIFPVGFQNVQVTYVGGFSAIPTSIELITAEFVIQLFDPTLSEDIIEKEKIGDYFYAKGINFIENLIFSKKYILNSYRIRRMSIRV